MVKGKRKCDQIFFVFLFLFLFFQVVIVSVLFLWVTEICVYLEWIPGLVNIPFAVKTCDFLNQSKKESFENLEMSMLVFVKYQEEKLQHFC